MKYMTKRWYETMQNTDYYLDLNISKKAEVFSEDYFRKLYKKEREDFDDEKSFNRYYKNQIKITKKKLPKYILDGVEDIRVLALGYASKKIYNKIKHYCEENEHFVNNAIHEYNKYYEKEFLNNKPVFLDDFSFHDCDIITTKEFNGDLIFYINNKKGFTKITFKKGKVIKQESELKDLWWLYEEIYRTNEKYEIHILARDKNGKLRNIIIGCLDIKCEHKDDFLFNSNIILKKDIIHNPKEAIEQGIDIMNSMPFVINITIFNHLIKVRNKIYIKDEIDKLHREIVEFLKNNEDKIIILNSYNGFIEVKLNSCDENYEILVNIKFNIKDKNGEFVSTFNIKTERCFLKTFADDIFELAQANFGHEIYLNDFNID